MIQLEYGMINAQPERPINLIPLDSDQMNHGRQRYT